MGELMIWIIVGTALSHLPLQTAAAPIPDDCTEHWATQRLDHYKWTGGGAGGQEKTFQQRYYVCAKHWTAQKPDGTKGPVFFYAGNEGPVTGYMTSAGLMFEHRERFGALVVFAEHRYYGATQPFGPDSWRVDPTYLTVEQAMADYTALLQNLTTSWNATGSPIVAFGGSYGGMLAAWMRRRYPHIIAGAVAASAPVGQFPGVPGFDPSAFWEVVTRDATPAAGAPPGCDSAVRAAFSVLFDAGASAAGRTLLSTTFRLCEALKDEGQVLALAYWAQGAFDAFAMGNYPFASDYMTGAGQGELPAWPMRAACEVMTGVAPSSSSSSSSPSHTMPSTTAASAPAPATAQPAKHSLHRKLWQLLTGRHRVNGRAQRQGTHTAAAAAAAAATTSATSAAAAAPPPLSQVELLERLQGAAALLYNASGTATCYSLDLAGPAAGSVGAWDYQVCTEFLGQELPYFPAAASSMFWDQGPFNWSSIEEHCRAAWGVVPSKTWMVEQHGGLDWRGTSNVVFSNGLLDPWSVFGVTSDMSDSVVAVLIPDGAHHLDLMYSRPDDSASLREARATIMAHVEQWVREGGQQQPEGRQQQQQQQQWPGAVPERGRSTGREGHLAVA